MTAPLRATNTRSSRWPRRHRAIIAYQTGKRDGFTTNDFMRDLSERVIGRAEISSDGFRPYLTAVPAAFGLRADHSVIVKTYNVTNLATP